jgi:hypothetical protein
MVLVKMLLLVVVCLTVFQATANGRSLSEFQENRISEEQWNALLKAMQKGKLRISYQKRHDWCITKMVDTSVTADGKQDLCEHILTSFRGEITSPNYPQDYPDNTACSWDIQVEEGMSISLRFTDFHVQPSQGCAADYVGVYNGEEYFLYIK